MSIKVSICIPCLNEEKSILKVLNNFKKDMPEAEIIVFDNDSNDKTKEITINNGFKCFDVKERGKGNVIRSIFKNINSDYIILVDGDNTYESKDGKKMLDLAIKNNSDLVIGSRKGYEKNQYRFGHKYGNIVFSKIVKFFFGNKFNDLFSGYRVLSKRFVKTFPITSKDFSIETEITIHAIQIDVKIDEIDSNYYARLPDSKSKLNTFKDGFKITNYLIKLIIIYKSHYIFFVVGFILLLSSLIIAIPQILIPWYNFNYVDKLATVVLVTGLAITGFFSVGFGILINSINSTKIEMKKIFFQTYK